MVNIIKLLAVFAMLVLLCSCISYAINRKGEKKESFFVKEGIKKVAIISLLEDNIFASREGYVFMETTPVAKVGWSSNDYAKEYIRNLLSEDEVDVVQFSYPANIMEMISYERNETVAQNKIIRILNDSSGNKEFNAYVIIYPLFINMYGRIANPLGAFTAFGPLGILSEAMAKYKPSYLLKLDSSLAKQSSCIIGFDISVVDAHTSKILGEKRHAFGEEHLAKNIWYKDYDAVSETDKQEIKDTCLSALSNGIARSLVKMTPHFESNSL